MRSFTIAAAAGAGMAVVPALALTPLQTFYPPKLNDTSYISDAAIGTYGGIYKAPTNGPTVGNPYGTYDYCSMPHPRVQEYEMPGPIAKGRFEGELVHLTYLQRHQRRSPYNILPGGENQPYYCDNVRPYLYAGPNSDSGMQPIPMYAQTYEDPTDPFTPGVNGSCQYPQITIGGVEDGYRHGQDLWKVYGQKLRLLPDSPGSGRVWFRSSDSPLTQASAGAVLRGVWPDFRGALPLHQMVSSVDTVNEGYPCGAIGSTLAQLEATAEWQQHLNVTAPLRARLGAMLGATASDWQTTFDHFSDNFQARLCNGYELPCSVADPSQCVSEADADEVFRAGDWEWNYYWRTNPYAEKYIQVVEGEFIGEIVAGLKAVQDGTSALDYTHVFIHDGDMGPVMGALGIDMLRWPAMASNAAFEVWRKTDKTDKTLYARVLYSGQPVKTIHGTLDWIPLSDLISILTPYVPTDLVSLCG